MGWQNLQQRKPAGASCNWVKEELAAGAPYKWWREPFGPICPVRLSIYITDGSAALSVTPPSGSWWTGGQSGGYYSAGLNACTATIGSYLLSQTFNGITIDVMRALKDSVWSSSIAFNVYVSGDGFTKTLKVQPLFINGGTPLVTQSMVMSPAISCTGGTLKIVTVYDDGRITIT